MAVTVKPAVSELIVQLPVYVVPLPVSTAVVQVPKELSVMVTPSVGAPPSTVRVTLYVLSPVVGEPLRTRAAVLAEAGDAARRTPPSELTTSSTGMRDRDSLPCRFEELEPATPGGLLTLPRPKCPVAPRKTPVISADSLDLSKRVTSSIAASSQLRILRDH
jgi:hypothetical protein